MRTPSSPLVAVFAVCGGVGCARPPTPPEQATPEQVPTTSASAPNESLLAPVPVSSFSAAPALASASAASASAGASAAPAPASATAPVASATPAGPQPPPLSAQEIDQVHTYGMRVLLEPDAPTARIAVALGETVEAASVLGGAAERWTWKKWKDDRALLERCVRAACETIQVPLAADRISPAVLHRKLAINAWSEAEAGPVDQARLVARVDPAAPFLFVRSYFGFERLERLPNSGDLTFMYRRYERAIKALPNKAYRDTLQLLARVPPPWLIDDFRKEIGRRGLSRAASAWLDQKGLHAPRFRYFCRQGRATEQERWAALGEVHSPEEFEQLRSMARRFGDGAMQSDLAEFAHAQRSRCGLADPPVVTDEYRRRCEKWSRLARQSPKPR